ncbi:uncharacterized transposon-derived protein F54H12.3 [Trichonephila clavipes]|nr:uncharacterized transposon-derived protein F54H12.3 [Trichonephila clavipes]GFU95596.1 uncharacterized transposon-derived protein F54H12.3 [Trichonephila clavipes]
MHQDLAAFYENPEVPNSFGGVEALHRSVKGKYSKKDVKHWLSQKDAYTLHKPVRHKFQRNRVFVSDIDRQFQADLVDMQSLAEFNKGYKYLLTCIDLFSKFAWAVPLKDKFGKSVKSGLEIIFKERKPKVLQTDADATSKPYGYLLIDLKPETDESLRVRTGMFPGDVFMYINLDDPLL